MNRFLFTTALLTLNSALLSAATIPFPGEYDHLQRAVNAAAPGDTILIAPGSYETTLIITKALTLQGSGKDQTILRPEPEQRSVVRFILAPKENAAFTLKDLTIQHSPDSDEDSNGSLLFVRETSPLIIENVDVDYSVGYGGTYIEDSLLQASQLSVVTKSSPALNLNSLREGSTITDLQLTMTSKDDGADDALWLENSCQVKLSTIKFNTHGTNSLAQVTGNLSRVTVTDSSIPADKITYLEGARADGPTDELLETLKQEGDEYGMMYTLGNRAGPGEDADFLAQLEPKRRKLARELQQSLNTDPSQAATHAALVKYISGLVSDIESGPTDYAADPAIHAELERFESTFGSVATSALIQALPPHPETQYYPQAHAYYTQFVSDAVEGPLNQAAQNELVARACQQIESRIAAWPTNPDLVPSAKAFFEMLRRLQYEVEALHFAYDDEAARATLNASALDAIRQKLQGLDIELIRAIKQSAPASMIKLISIDQLTAAIESARATELQATALAETRINAGPNSRVSYIWKSPDGQYMITSGSDGIHLYDAQAMLRLQKIGREGLYLTNEPCYEAHSNQVLLPLERSAARFDLDRRMIVSSERTDGEPLIYYSPRSKSTYSLTQIYGVSSSSLAFARIAPAPKVTPKYSTSASGKETLYPSLIHELNPNQVVVQYYDKYFMPAFTGTFDSTQDSQLQEVKSDLGRLVTTTDGQLLAIKDTEVLTKEGGTTYTTVTIHHLANDPSLRIEKTLEIKLPYHRSKYGAQRTFANNASTKQIVVGDIGFTCILNYETGAIDGIIDEATLGSKAYISAEWIEDAQHLVISYSAVGADEISRSHFARFDIATGQHLVDLGKPAHYPNQLFADSEQSDLYTLNRRGTLKRVRMNPNGFTVKTLQNTASAFAINSQSGLIAYANFGDNRIHLTDRDSILDGQDILPVDSSAPKATIDALFFSQDGSMLGIRTPQKFYALSVDSGEIAFEMTFTQAHHLVAQNPGGFSPDGSIAVISQYKASATGTGYDIEKWLAFDVATGKALWETSAGGGNFAGLDASGNNAFISRGGANMIIDFQTGKRIGSDGPRVGYRSTWAATTPDGARIATSDETDRIKIGNTSTTSDELSDKIELKNKGASISALTFLADENYLAATDRDGFIRIWNLEQQALIAKLALFENDSEWAITTPDNRFDTAPGTSGLVYFVAGKELLPTDALFETYYTPKLLPTLLAGSELEPVPELSSQTLPPEVKLGLAAGSRGLFVEDDDALSDTVAATVRLKAEAFSMHSSINEIRLYHNEKLITTATRGLFVEDDVLDEAQAKTQEYTVQLLPGENSFVARAFDGNRMEGRSKTFRIKGAESSLPAGQGGGLNLHIIVVGIDSYTNSKYDLNYAVADASAFLKKIESANQNLFTRITPYFISNREATGSKILEAFKAVQQSAHPRDLFIFYYAGHGVMAQSADKQFYLVPTDVTQLYGDDAQLAQKAISSQQLLQLSKDIPAQKQLFILDACQSAGALQSIAMRGAAEEKAIAQLARSTGTHWLTASGSEQFATEFSELGHGAFTYTLLQALDGKADTGDLLITVNELKAYLESQVPEVTAKHKGTPQYPSSYGYGNDFPVGARTQ